MYFEELHKEALYYHERRQQERIKQERKVQQANKYAQKKIPDATTELEIHKYQEVFEHVTRIHSLGKSYLYKMPH